MLKILAKSTRIRVYKQALEIYSSPSNEYVGICAIIASAQTKLGIKRRGLYGFDHEYTCREHWPELYSYRTATENLDGFWWPMTDNRIRIQVLKRLVLGLSKDEHNPNYKS